MEAKSSDGAFTGGNVESRIRCRPGIERWPGIDDLAFDRVGFDNHGNLRGAVAAAAMRSQIGQDFVQHQSGVVRSAVFDPVIAEKGHDLIGQIGDRVGGRERAGFEPRLWSRHGDDFGSSGSLGQSDAASALQLTASIVSSRVPWRLKTLSKDANRKVTNA